MFNCSTMGGEHYCIKPIKAAYIWRLQSWAVVCTAGLEPGLNYSFLWASHRPAPS